MHRSSLIVIVALAFTCEHAARSADPQPKSAAASPVETLSVDLGGGVTMKFAKIPAGKFKMGVPEDAPDRDKQDLPVTEVTIAKPFWMGITEVTQAQFETVMGENPSKIVRDPQYPVETVTPKQVDEFCKKISAKLNKTARMPTEAEWEYAARAGSDGLGGAKLADVAWFQGNSDKKPHPVATKAANAWGLHDMIGNINEWVRGEKWIGYRGACWRTVEKKSKPTHREGHGELHSDPYGGFRVLVEAE